MSARSSAGGVGVWLRPLGYLAAIAAVFVVAPFVLDQLAVCHEREDLSWIVNLPEVFAGVLGIAVTVVAIIVELAANRYTSRITELFFRARINKFVMSFFVISCVQCIWVAFQTSDVLRYKPVVGTHVALGSVTLSLLLLLPYFVFVFDFLNPQNVIRRLRQHVVDEITEVRCATVDLDESKI